MSTAVELTLDAVVGRPTEPVMLDKPLSIDELPTPALVLDREVMAANIKTMAQHLSEHGKDFVLTLKRTNAQPSPDCKWRQVRWASVPRKSAKPQ